MVWRVLGTSWVRNSSRKPPKQPRRCCLPRSWTKRVYSGALASRCPFPRCFRLSIYSLCCIDVSCATLMRVTFHSPSARDVRNNVRPRGDDLIMPFCHRFWSRFPPPLYRQKAQEIVRTFEAEAKVVEHQLSRVGYMKFSEKVRHAIVWCDWLCHLYALDTSAWLSPATCRGGGRFKRWAGGGSPRVLTVFGQQEGNACSNGIPSFSLFLSPSLPLCVPLSPRLCRTRSPTLFPTQMQSKAFGLPHSRANTIHHQL